MLKVRASGCSPLFTGDDGLTSAQQSTLDELLQKIKLTEKQAEKRDELVAKRDAKPELSTGAKTLVEDYIDQVLYEYKENFSSPKTEKGWLVEDASIDVYNRLFFTSHKKLDEGEKYYSLSYGIMTGHPDIVDCERKRVIDIKSSWTKKTFPKTPDKAYDIGYQWQVKAYLYMLTKTTGEEWRSGEVAHVLASTPEEIKPEWESDSLHYMEDLPDNLRVTIVPVELTDDDIAKIERRLSAAEEYAVYYFNLIKSKNECI